MNAIVPLSSSELGGYNGYYTSVQLHFGHLRLLSSTEVQQGDPLGPLLLSLVVLDGIDLPQEMFLQLWYLDNGSFVRSQVVVFNLLAQISARGPWFALHMNLMKCKVFWPSGDQYFPKFPDEVRLPSSHLVWVPVWRRLWSCSHILEIWKTPKSSCTSYEVV